MYKAFAVVITSLSLSLGIVACGQEVELEQAGKRIEKATENAGDKIEQRTDQATTGEKPASKDKGIKDKRTER
jgi:CHASE1-domain containing sensor protein